MILNFNTAPPRYNLESDLVIALKGESAELKFTVISDHKMPANIKHSIRRADGGNVRNKFYEASEDCITFPKVKHSDNGTYTISCHNNAGLKGKKFFDLIVVPGIIIIIGFCSILMDC